MLIVSGSLLEVVLGLACLASYGVHAKRSADLRDVKRTIRRLATEMVDDPDGAALHDLRCARNRAARLAGVPPEDLRPEELERPRPLRTGIPAFPPRSPEPWPTRSRKEPNA